eukprot:2687042-Rhodomonas_salina.1
MREDAVGRWMSIIREQLESLSPAISERILELSTLGMTPREITEDWSLEDHGLAVATVEVVLRAAENEGNSPTPTEVRSPKVVESILAQLAGSVLDQNELRQQGGTRRWTAKRCFKVAVGRSFKTLFKTTTIPPNQPQKDLRLQEETTRQVRKTAQLSTIVETASARPSSS